MAFIISFLLLKKFEKVEKTVFLGLILRFSNLNVLHKGILMQDWVFRLGMCDYLLLQIPYQYSNQISAKNHENFIISVHIKKGISTLLEFPDDIYS